MTRALLVLVIAFFPLNVAVAGPSDGQVIEDTYNAWVAVTNTKDIESWASYLAPGARFLPPDSGALTTNEEIRQYYVNTFADPNFTIACQQLTVEVAPSGDMAWATGTCKVTFSGADGEVAGAASKWAKVWAKQPAGIWKCKLNIWNADPAASP